MAQHFNCGDVSPVPIISHQTSLLPFYLLPVQRLMLCLSPLISSNAPPGPLGQGQSSNMICCSYFLLQPISIFSAHCHPGFQIPELADALWPQGFVRNSPTPRLPPRCTTLHLTAGWASSQPLLEVFLGSQNPTRFLYSSHYFW